MAKLNVPARPGFRSSPGLYVPLSKGKNSIFLLTALVVAVGGILLLPVLRWALAPLGLWALALLASLLWFPHFLKRLGLWLGSFLLIWFAAGVLALALPNGAGSLGQYLVGQHLILGAMGLAFLLILATWALTPRLTWGTTRWLAQRLKHLGRWGLRLFLRLLRSVGTWLTSRIPGPWRRPLLGQGLQEGGLEVVVAPQGGSGQALKAPRPRGGGAENSKGVVQGKRSRSLGGWALPKLDLLDEGEETEPPEEENLAKAHLIEESLSEYGLDVSVEDIRPGPVVTQFGLVPGWIRRYREVRERDKDGQPRIDRFGRPIITSIEEKTRVKVDAILQREKDLSLALAARSIRFEAPVPGEPFVGLEVPNDEPGVVGLRSVMASAAFRGLQRRGHLALGLGQGSGGEPVVADLVEMPHLLIAGTTGSGKSVCINTIVCGLIMQFTPYDLRFLMVDPKRVELTPYNGLPHLLTPVVVEAEKTIPLLQGLVQEMKARYRRLEEVKVRNIQGFNQQASLPAERMPYLVLIVDELADLMMAAPAEVEQSLCRLAQLGRAVGIHLIIATQRPSVDVLTGLIKANFPSRISFAVSSQIDSRVVLDTVGAEKLLGRGDMLFLPTYFVKPKRLQGVYISEAEAGRLMEHWKSQSAVTPPPISLEVPEVEDGDALLAQAREIATHYSRLSTSLLQRRLGIGYPRAARLLDRLEELGVIGHGEVGRPREVLIQHRTDGESVGKIEEG